MKTGCWNSCQEQMRLGLLSLLSPSLSFLRVCLPPAEMWTGGDPSGDSLICEPPPVKRLEKNKRRGVGEREGN